MNQHSLSLTQLRADYLRRLPERVAAIQFAFDRADYGAVRAIAHQLRGSGRSYGFAHVTETAEALEAACSDGQVTLIRAAIAALDGLSTELRSTAKLDS
jgi:HPt (histidine-containing phosphotransfer) domain-containing protein